MSKLPAPAVLYSDDWILAVAKPAGVSVIHDSHRLEEGTLTQRLEGEFGKLFVVHRLDRETSGVLLYARNREAHRQLSSQFENRAVKKVYHLLACGQFEWKSTDVNLPLKVNGDRRHRTVIDTQAGKPASTRFSVIQSFGSGLNFLSASPSTGYTHQIRAHLSSLNACILFDRLYRPHPFPPGEILSFDHAPAEEYASRVLPIRRLALHASEIRFSHPIQGDERTINAPFPDDFKESLDILNKTGQTEPPGLSNHS